MGVVSVFSPATAGSVGHGFVYGMRLCALLGKRYKLTLFTINDKTKIEKLEEAGIKVIASSRFKSGAIDKRRFNKFLILSRFIYGVYRVYYNYKLIDEFFKTNKDSQIFHFFEFEYIALCFYLLKNKPLLSKTVLGIHIADFKWIKGRAFSVNLYKTLIRQPMAKLCKHAAHITTHGNIIRSIIIKDLGVSPSHVTALNYGCDVHEIGLSKTDARVHLGINVKNRIVALFFGVLRSDKGLLEVLRNFNRISSEVMLLIVGGEGDIKYKTVTQAIKKFGLDDRVLTVFKYIEEEEVKYYFYASDFVLIPHKGDHIAFSGPLSLAVEYCRPVIASNIGEIGAFVNKNMVGFLFDHDNWDSFVHVVNNNINNIHAFKSQQFHCIQRNNSWRNMADQISLIYNKTIDRCCDLAT